MQEVLRYIERRTAQQENSPLIVWLLDEAVPARDRLMRWLPCAAPWVFGFMDLNGVLLRYGEDEASRDPYKKAINDHLDEDANHWPYYLEDLRRLELDAQLTFPEVLQFLWGDETFRQRMGVYKLSALAAQAEEPMLRYCLIAALEAFAHLLFDALQQVSIPFSQQTGVELLYVGAIHADKEPGHLANQEDQEDIVETRMQAEVLDESTRRRGLDIARQVCDVVAERWIELYHFAQSDGHLAFLRGGQGALA
jgi:hypothetical protein